VLPSIHLADLVTVGFLVVLESLLSADNALVMAVMVIGLDAREHRKALSYGLVGALTFRIIATVLALYLIQMPWLKLLGGLYLLYLGVTHFFGGGGAAPGARREARPMLGLSPFWATVVRVELVNIAFSIDSILVAVAMSNSFWVILTGGLLGVAAMRAVVTQLVRLIQRYPGLVDGAFVIIIWVAVKLILDYARQINWIGWEIPQTASLAVVVGIFIGSLLIARRRAANPRYAGS
jgi:YkoY family integral membrane protein